MWRVHSYEKDLRDVSRPPTGPSLDDAVNVVQMLRKRHELDTGHVTTSGRKPDAIVDVYWRCAHCGVVWEVR